MQICPSSFDEVEKAIQEQLVPRAGKAGSQEIKISRSLNRKLLIIWANHDVKVGMKENAIELRRGTHKVVMHLDAFKVNTSVDQKGTTLELLTRTGLKQGL